MYEKTNLLGIHANAPNQWVNKVMRILFNQDELANGIVSDDPASSRSDRVPLDSAKVGLLKKAAFIKFKVNSDNEGAKWLEYKKTANSLCYEYPKNKSASKKQNKITSNNDSD